MDWSSIVASVADIAVKILPLFFGKLEKGAGEFDYYLVGDIAFYPYSGSVWACNMSETDEMGISYSVSTAESALSVYQPLSLEEAYDATQDMADFQFGQLTIGPTLLPGSAASLPTGPGRAISFAISLLSVGMTVRIIGNTRIGVKKDGQGFYFEITNDNPMAGWEGTVSATDTRGGTVTAHSKWTSKKVRSPQDYSWEIPLPPGTDLDPVVAKLTVYLVMDQQTYADATAERRRRVLTRATHDKPRPDRHK